MTVATKIYTAFCYRTVNALYARGQTQEMLHHLGTQKGSNLCLKCTKIRLPAGLCQDPLGLPGPAGGA